MTEKHPTKLKLSLGNFVLDFEGSESFLRSEVPKFIDCANAIRMSELRVSSIDLQGTIQESLRLTPDIEDAMASLKSELDSMSEMGEMESLRLQMAMDRMSKMMSTLSNLLKKISDTAQSITQNIK